MNTLADLQASIQDTSAFTVLNDYLTIGRAYLAFVEQAQPTRIVSPTQPDYIFYQYNQAYRNKITRPLNTRLFFESAVQLEAAFERFFSFLDDLRQYQGGISGRPGISTYLAAKEIHRVIYTVQQVIGCIGDSFENANQTRKRIGQLFERLIRLVIREMGLICESRTIQIPIPSYPDYSMSYELDIVFSHHKAVITAETRYIYPSEVVGSIKTTSKDRLDKVFLDKYLLSKFIGRDIPMIAVFLHDVQRARRGNSIFGINSTFKTNHFLGYTLALNRLDGVYYIDPRPEMTHNERLREYISDFQQFLVRDVWHFSGE